MLGLRYPTELNLIGDSAQSLRALIPLLQRKTDRSWREKIEADIRDWWKVIEARAKDSADPINPGSLSPGNFYRAYRRTAFSRADAGTTANWYGRTIKMRKGMMGSLSGKFASDGGCYSLPQFPRSSLTPNERQLSPRTGDGAMQMNGLNEMITVGKYWQQWEQSTHSLHRAQQPRPQPGHLGRTH